MDVGQTFEFGCENVADGRYDLVQNAFEQDRRVLCELVPDNRDVVYRREERVAECILCLEELISVSCL